MKTISIKTLATGIVASTLLFAASCKKGDTGPAGTPGTNGSNGVVATSTDGYIKGTVSGVRQDGTAFSESYDFENYYGSPSGTLDSSGVVNPYTFNINRAMDIFGNNSASIAISVATTTATTGNLTLNNFTFTKSLGTNKEFVLNLNNSVSGTVNNLSYNPSTGMFTGSIANITVNAAQNSTGHTVNISINFQATITQLFMMTHHNGTKAVTAKASAN